MINKKRHALKHAFLLFCRFASIIIRLYAKAHTCDLLKNSRKTPDFNQGI